MSSRTHHTLRRSHKHGLKASSKLTLMLAAGFLLVSAGLLLATFDERVLRGIRGTLFAPEIESQLQPQLSQPQQQQPLLLPRQRSAIVDTRPAPPAAQAGPPTAASSPGSQFRAPTVNQSELRLGEIPFETALQYHRVAVYSPALAVHATNPPSLWAYLRYEGRNTTDKWDQCPLDHPSRLIPCPRNDLRMISFNVRCELNPATLMCRTAFEAMPYQINWDRAAKRKNKDEIELGPEDPRVLHAADGRVFLFYNSPPIHDFKAPACIRNMKVQQVFPDLGRVVDLDLLDDKMNRYEKNWSPITISSDGEHVLLSRFVNPHQIVGCHLVSGKCNVVANNTVIPHLHRLVTDNEYRDLHLGTNAVLSPSKTTYIAIFHGITIKQKRYHNYVYEFAAQPPWRILRVSAKPLELPLGKIVRRGFVFSSSLTRVGDKYVVGYTVNDVSAIFKVFTEAELLADMVEVKE